MRDYSVPALETIADDTSMPDIVFRRAADQPQRAIMRRRSPDGRWREVTAATFRSEVMDLARHLLAAGIEPGERVALMSRTRYEWTLIDYAIWTAGAVTVPVYETSSAEQVEWILGDSGARAVFAETSSHAELIQSVRDRLPDLRDVWLIDDLAALTGSGAGPGGAGPGDGEPGDRAASDRAVSDEDVLHRRAGRRADDLATIIYTSGTTGRPKGCELSHRNLLADVRNAVTGSLAAVFEAEGGSTLLFLPLAHSFARIIQIGCLESGAVLGHWSDASTLTQGLPEFRPTFLLAVPRVFEKVFNGAQQQAAASPVKRRIFATAVTTAVTWSQAQGSGAGDGHGDRDGDRAAAGRAGPVLRLRHGLFDRLVYSRLRAALGGDVRYAVSGGAALGERLGHFFRGAGITVLEGYGLTETSAAAFVNHPGRNKVGTVGPPLPGVSVRIAGDDEILLAGPNIFAGYWHNKSATAEVLDDDGWLHTGDLGALDDDGYLRVTGRKKELIVTAGGKNVAPAVLEDRLRAHPLISQCMVVGDGRPYIACLITLDSEALDQWKQQHGRPASAAAADLADDRELIADIQGGVDEANKAVSRAESIRRFRVLATDFTEENGHLTPSLKVRRSVVARDLAAEINALYR